MPWTVDDVDRFKKGLTATQKKRWVKVANSAYERCAEEGEKTNLDCEVSAIRIANAKFSDNAFSVNENICPAFPGINFKKFKEVALQEAEVTDEFQMVLPVGLFYSKWYGEIIITENYCKALVENWEKKVLREQQPFLDTEHDRGKSNGWIKEMEARPDGLYIKWDFTELGRKNIGEGLYRYYSADIDLVIDIDTGEEIYPVLIAVALCNTPVMKTMPQAHLSEKSPAEAQQMMLRTDLMALAENLKSFIMNNNPAHSDGIQYTSKDINMDELLKLFMALSLEERKQFAEKLTEALKGEGEGANTDGQEPGTQGAQPPDNQGQGQGTTPAAGGTGNGTSLSTGGTPPTQGQAVDENKKLAELVKQNEEMAAQLKKLTESRAGEGGQGQGVKTDDPKVNARIALLEHSNKQLSEQIDRILKKDHAERKDKVIGLALNEGRMLPKDKKFYEDKFDQDPDGVEEILKRTPAVKIFSESGTGSDGKSFTLNETAEERAQREAMGISVEDAIKFGEGYKPAR